MKLFRNLKRRSQIRTLYKEYCSLIGRTDRVAAIKAKEIAVLLDALRIWEHEEFIPIDSEYIQPVERGTMTFGDLTALVEINKHHLTPAKAGVPVKDRGRIALKCRKTGLIQETSQKP